MRKIAVIPGDGIGIEVIKGAIQVLKKSEEIIFDKSLFDLVFMIGEQIII